ncbi:MAG: hypothetical protein IJS28_07210 [Synergistaceae bacterium]|nr:hypothetical protein [Synergistaceae bacterium]
MNPKAGYKSNSLIAMASHYMKPYRFSPDEAAEVGMFPKDTGLIVLLILYLLDFEEKVCRSKLEYYILLLDRKCFGEKGAPLFTWNLKNGRIRNFDKFTKFMMEKRLIFSNGSAYFILDEAGQTIINQCSALLVNVKCWLDTLLAEWGDKTVAQMKNEVMGARHDRQYQDALNNVRELLGL